MRGTPLESTFGIHLNSMEFSGIQRWRERQPIGRSSPSRWMHALHGWRIVLLVLHPSLLMADPAEEPAPGQVPRGWRGWCPMRPKMVIAWNVAAREKGLRDWRLSSVIQPGSNCSYGARSS